MATKKKAAPKKAAPKKSGAKKAAPKKALVKKAGPKKAAPKKAVTASRGGSVPANPDVTPAVVHVEFRNANTGASDCTISVNNQNPRNVTGSEDVPVMVQRGDRIVINSYSPGDTTITVSGVNTRPGNMTAVPGQVITKFFVIL